jgi:hypothetical protein
VTQILKGNTLLGRGDLFTLRLFEVACKECLKFLPIHISCILLDPLNSAFSRPTSPLSVASSFSMVKSTDSNARQSLQSKASGLLRAKRWDQKLLG